MNIIIPLAVTAAMIQAGTTIAEPDLTTGEAAWVSGAAHVVDNERVWEHGIYSCVQDHTGRATVPALDAAYWKYKRPCNRWMPFDAYTVTAATAVGGQTYVLQPGFFNALSLYGLVGASIDVTVKDAPLGAVTYSHSSDLFEQATGLYELLFAPLLARKKLVLKGIPISPTAELTITVSADPSDPVAIGMINVGDYRPVIGAAAWGGTEYGAGAEPKSFSYIKFYDDGTSEIKRRGSATDLRGTVAMPAEAAQYAVETIQQVLDVPVSCIATDVAGYDYLNVFGLISATAIADGPGQAKLNYSVKGFL